MGIEMVEMWGSLMDDTMVDMMELQMVGQLDALSVVHLARQMVEQLGSWKENRLVILTALMTVDLMESMKAAKMESELVLMSVVSWAEM